RPSAAEHRPRRVSDAHVGVLQPRVLDVGRELVVAVDGTPPLPDDALGVPEAVVVDLVALPLEGEQELVAVRPRAEAAAHVVDARVDVGVVVVEAPVEGGGADEAPGLVEAVAAADAAGEAEERIALLVGAGGEVERAAAKGRNGELVRGGRRVDVAV